MNKWLIYTYNYQPLIQKASLMIRKKEKEKRCWI